MAKTTAQPKETKEKKPKYTVSVLMAGKKFESTGSTIEEALTNVKVGGIARSKVIITISNGKETKERVMLPFTVNKLISLSPSMKQIAVKQIAVLFNL